VQGRNLLGTTTLTVQATGYTTGTAAVAVQPAGFVFATGDVTTTFFSTTTSLSVVPAVLDPDTFVPAIFGQSVRGGLTVSVPVTSGTPAVGTIVGSPAVFSPGDTENLATAFAPLATGISVLRVGVPAGFSPPASAAQITATVTAPTVSVNGGDAIAVGQNLQVPVSIGLNVLPPGPRTVTVTSSNGNLATVSADPTLEGGTSATFRADPGTGTFTLYVQGRNLLGTTTLTVQATGYTTGTAAVAVQPAGFVFSPIGSEGSDFTTTVAAPDTLLSVVAAQLDPTFLNPVQSQSVRGGLTVTVPVMSGTPAVGTIVGSPAVFSPGDAENVATAFMPLAVGTSVLTVGIPAGFSPSSTGGQITATVQ